MASLLEGQGPIWFMNSPTAWVTCNFVSLDLMSTPDIFMVFSGGKKGGLLFSGALLSTDDKEEKGRATGCLWQEFAFVYVPSWEFIFL